MTKVLRPEDPGRDQPGQTGGAAPTNVVPLRPDDPVPVPDISRRRHLWRCVVILLAVVISILLSASILLTAIVVRQERLAAPDWLRARIEERLETQFPGLQVRFDDLGLVFAEGGRMRIRLENVDLAMSNGSTNLSVAEISGDLAAAPLLRGRIQPESLSVSGLQFLLRRGADGRFNIFSTAGEPSANTAAAAGRDLQAAVDEFKTLLSLDNLSRLTEIHGDGLSVAYEDLRAGRSWSVDGGLINLARSGEGVSIVGDFTLLGGHAYATVIRTTYETRLGDSLGQFSLSIQDMAAADLASQSPALAWLGVLDAPISGALRMPLDGGGPAGPVNATLQIGQGVLQPTPDVEPLPFSLARTYFTFDPESETLRFSELSVDSERLKAMADGALRLVSTGDGGPQLVGQLNLSRVSLGPGALGAGAPDLGGLNLTGGQLDLKLQVDPFRLDLGSARVSAGDLTLAARGHMLADAAGWSMSMDGHVDEIGNRALLAHWPEGVAAGARTWVAENVEEARLHDIQLGLKAEGGATPDLYLGFEFDNLSTRILKGLPVATGVSGQASLLRNRFAIQAETGQLAAPGRGAVDMAGSAFIIPDVRIKQGPAEARLQARTAIPDALALLDQPRFELLTKAGQPVDLADGRAEVTADLAFPLRKGKLEPGELKLKLDGVLTRVQSDVLAKGHRLTADRLTLTGTEEALTISGNAALDGVALTGQWHSNLGPASAEGSQVTAQIRLDRNFVETFKLGLPPEAITGSGTADLSIKLVKGVPPRLRLTSDLTGLGLRIDALNWTLPRASTGQLEITGSLAEPAHFDLLRLEAPGFSAVGSVSMKPDGSLDTLNPDRVRVGSWLDAPVVLRGAGRGTRRGWNCWGHGRSAQPAEGQRQQRVRPRHPGAGPFHNRRKAVVAGHARQLRGRQGPAGQLFWPHQWRRDGVGPGDAIASGAGDPDHLGGCRGGGEIGRDPAQCQRWRVADRPATHRRSGHL
ncbi:hypothetical protein [Pseudooceanicola algae]|uniref:DUF3971 domain-containing protein n=1 Tax=Pseudooceanicola algae TaxID=1537215 RepID=A0A7T1BSX5_9RHOB|nr:hypothetical protein PSAL_011150 [Pseudooceanicola algae]